MACFSHERQRLMGNSSELIVLPSGFGTLFFQSLVRFLMRILHLCWSVPDFAMLLVPSGRQGIHVHEAPDCNGNCICDTILR